MAYRRKLESSRRHPAVETPYNSRGREIAIVLREVLAKPGLTSKEKLGRLYELFDEIKEWAVHSDHILLGVFLQGINSVVREFDFRYGSPPGNTVDDSAELNHSPPTRSEWIAVHELARRSYQDITNWLGPGLSTLDDRLFFNSIAAAGALRLRAASVETFLHHWSEEFRRRIPYAPIDELAKGWEIVHLLGVRSRSDILDALLQECVAAERRVELFDPNAQSSLARIFSWSGAEYARKYLEGVLPVLREFDYSVATPHAVLALHRAALLGDVEMPEQFTSEVLPRTMEYRRTAEVPRSNDFELSVRDTLLQLRTPKIYSVDMQTLSAGGFYIDLTFNAHGRKYALECDGISYHYVGGRYDHRYRMPPDILNDQLLAKEGYLPIRISDGKWASTPIEKRCQMLRDKINRAFWTSALASTGTE